MRTGFLACALVLLAPILTSCHMPAGAGKGTKDAPVDLGDPTINSWALTGECRASSLHAQLNSSPVRPQESSLR
jgi:predicted small secreted protein